jgi:putative tricarboxylic transport membrane protein
MSFRIIISAVVVLVALASSAAAQTFPNRAITMIVPFSAGGPSDVLARLIAQSMSRSLGQTFVIENIGGAGGTTGAGRLARAEPDGYTLMMHHMALASGATLYPTLPYDTLSDFESIGLVAQGPYVILSRPGFPAQTAADFLAVVKAQQQTLIFAHAGVGSGAHLCNMLLQSMMGVKLNEVPYRGSGPAMNDLIGGQIDVLCDQTSTAIPQIRSGSVRAHAVTSTERIAQLPDLPTLHEAGIAGFELKVWHALYAPRRTPIAIVQRLNQALKTALTDPHILARLTDLGMVPFAEGRRGPAEAREQLEREVTKWRRIIREAGVATGN